MTPFCGTTLPSQDVRLLTIVRLIKGFKGSWDITRYIQRSVIEVTAGNVCPFCSPSPYASAGLLEPRGKGSFRMGLRACEYWLDKPHAAEDTFAVSKKLPSPVMAHDRFGRGENSPTTSLYN